MNVKLDTKEKFSVITPVEMELTAIMTAEMQDLLKSWLDKECRHIVLNMSEVGSISPEIAVKLSAIQQEFYEHNASFVICCLSDQAEKLLDNMELLEFMNVTPTESEAWDIVQMEEIERELLNDFDEETE